LLALIVSVEVTHSRSIQPRDPTESVHMTQRQRDMQHNEAVLASSERWTDSQGMGIEESIQDVSSRKGKVKALGRQKLNQLKRHPSPPPAERIQARMDERKVSHKKSRQRMHRMQVNQTS
jgi:hypothetical protein